MQTILVIGAGKSATVLIRFLLQHQFARQFVLIVADADISLAAKKTGTSENVRQLDVNDQQQLDKLVLDASVVISLLPPSLHQHVAFSCLRHGRPLLTASYVDPVIRSMDDEIRNKGLLFLCEMGLDPGIDHMSAMRVLSELRSGGAHIRSFVSHCGGLVARESDNNPWHYKISWNPRNVVMAGSAGATYLLHGETMMEDQNTMFQTRRTTVVNGETFAWYPNRDSLAYIPLYHLGECSTFLRTTLRHPSFMEGWQHLLALQFTDDLPWYDTDNLTVQSFFEAHFERFRKNILLERFATSPIFIEQLRFLGWETDTSRIPRGKMSAIEVLQYLLERKLELKLLDRDRVVMQHEIVYELEGKSWMMTSSLDIEGDDGERTAMARTVGMPLALAALKMLGGEINLTGVQIPTDPAIYQAVLPALEEEGIRFTDVVIGYDQSS